MIDNSKILHSHSALERDLKMPKWLVLIDTEFGDMFDKSACTPCKYNGVKYYRIPIALFVAKNGVFKNFYK